MNIGILGTRHVHAEGLARHAEQLGATIIGAYEPDEQARTRWSCSPTMSRDEVIERADAVIVAGTNRERVDDVLAATDAGLHVLSEKPVALDASDLERLITHVRSELVMVALPVRFARSLQQARDAIRAGALGTPLAARCTNHGQYPGGWFGIANESGGGALQDHIVHVADVLCWLFDDQAVRSYAQHSQRMHPDLDVDSCGVATIDFQSGMFASIDASWSRPESFTTWGDVWLELTGTNGRMLIDPMATRYDYFDDSSGKLRHMGYSDDDMTKQMVHEFLSFARGEQSSPVTLAEGVHASDIVFASYASAASGHPEPVTARSLAHQTGS